MTKELLKRYFGNKVSVEEQAAVTCWMMDPANRAELLDYIEVSWFADEVQDSPVASFDSVYNKLINEANEGAKVVPMRSRRWVWAASAAACVVFLAAGTWMGYYWKKSGPGENEWVLSTARTGKGQRTQLLLSDGSEVYLNADTRLAFPQKKDVQQVVYLEGEAYFNIKNAAKPVTIKTKDITTIANSSKINISAFPKDSTVTVSVEKGKAEIMGNTEIWPMMDLLPPLAKRDSIKKAKEAEKSKIMPMLLIRPMTVKENQSMTFDKGSQVAGVTDRVGDDQISAWKDGVISFNNADAAEIASKLERWFGIEVIMNAGNMNPYTGEFKNAGLKQILDHISEVLNVAYTIKGDIVTITKHK